MASSRTFTTSPLMFESDDEDFCRIDELARESNTNDEDEKHPESSVPAVVDEPTKEERLLKRFQTVLMGIPPPPAFTVPQLDTREVLMLWRDNQKYRVVISPKKDTKDEAVVLENNVKSTKWPEALKIDHWDVYYNRSAACEEMERLSMRYKERYVGAETSSCVNALFAKSPSRTASARKRARTRARTRAWGHSPGRRLSHLARRRKAFSYCSVAGNNNPDKKMIMVEIKKMSNRQKKRNSAKKTKPTPKKKSQLQLNNYKRALFQSPDQLPRGVETQTPNTQCVQRSKRNLFIETSSEKINENGKRERTVVRRVSPRKRVNRSLSFQDNTPLPTDRREAPVTTSSAQALKTILSGAHKQKLLWAVTNALRDEAMGMNHDLFRPCMSVLFKACQKLWLAKAASSAQEGSTSENMLALAKQFTSFTINQISQDPTAEHMALVCGNIIKIAESQAKSEALSAAKRISDENTRDELKSIKSSPIRPHESWQQPGSDLEKECSFKEDLVIGRSTDSAFNTSSHRYDEQNFSEQNIQSRDLPCELNTLRGTKIFDLKVVLTPLKEIKNCKCASNPQDTKVESDSNSFLSPLKSICEKSKPLRRVSRNSEYCEVLSRSKENGNKSCESPQANNFVLDTVQKGTIAFVSHEEPSITEDSDNTIIDSNQIYTPSKIIGNIDTQIKDSTNAFRRDTRRKSNELIEENITSTDVEIQNSKLAVESIKRCQITSPTKNEEEFKIKDENTKLQSYRNTKPHKKSSFKKKKKSEISKKNILCVNETASLSMILQSCDNVQTNHSSTSSVSQESTSDAKVPEVAQKSTRESIANIKLESVIFPKNNPPSNSVLCKPLVRTLRSNSKDSPGKSVTVKENETVYFNLSSNIYNENKAEKPTKTKRRKSLTGSTVESNTQKGSLIEINCVETIKPPSFVDFNETEKSLSQESTDSNFDRKQDCEKNKENVENNILANSHFSERSSEVNNSTYSNPVKRLPVLTPYTPSDQVVNRTLQLYRLSNSGCEDIEPPLLVPHWEQLHQQQESTRCTNSPPKLEPYCEQPECSGSTSLPESIMAHWQEMTGKSSTSDKIMFDFEDTSYEIQFSPNNEDSTASSICAPFEFPNLIDDSKSGFNMIYRKNNTDSCEW